MSHCAPSEMNTSVSLIPMFGYTFSAMAFLRVCKNTCIFVRHVSLVSLEYLVAVLRQLIWMGGVASFLQEYEYIRLLFFVTDITFLICVLQSRCFGQVECTYLLPWLRAVALVAFRS